MTVTLDAATADVVIAEASKRGQEMETFLARALRRGIAAEQSEYATITLTNAERDTFLHAVDTGEMPGEKSLVAAERYREGQQSGEAYRW